MQGNEGGAPRKKKKNMASVNRDSQCERGTERFEGQLCGRARESLIQVGEGLLGFIQGDEISRLPHVFESTEKLHVR